MQSAPPRPAVRRARREPPPRTWVRGEEPRGPASALAFTLTLAGCWIIAATAQRIHEDRGGTPRRSAEAPEQIVYVAPERPVPALVPPPLPTTTDPADVPSRAPRVPGSPRAPAVWTLPAPLADSVTGAAPRADAATRSPRATAPAPGEVFRGPVGAPLCLPPCGVRPPVGLGRAAPPLTMAQMDSVLQDVRGAVRTAPTARPRAPVATGPSQLGAPPPIMPGVGVQVPLPGGGPSAEERRRDSVANAAALERLRRVRARADSLAARRLDSLERSRPRRP